MGLRGLTGGPRAFTPDERRLVGTPATALRLRAILAWILLLFGFVAVVLAEVTLDDGWLWAGGAACIAAGTYFAYGIYQLRRESA